MTLQPVQPYTSQAPNFHRAIVAQNTGHDFSELLTLAGDIKFVSNGYEVEDQLLEIVTTAMQDFSPRRDVIVPVGNVYINVLLGIIAAELSREWGRFWVALYRDKTYHLREVPLADLGAILDALINPSNS